MTRTYRERQTSFAGGEFSPNLWGRTDYKMYQSGARTLENFFVTPWGTAMNRPGSLAIEVSAISEQGGATARPRLVPFVFSDDQMLLLCFRARRLSFYRYSSTLGRVEAIVPSVTRDDPTYPWVDADIPKMRFSQVGDVVTFTVPSVTTHAGVFKLTRTASDSLSWTLEVVDFAGPSFPSYGGTPRLRYTQTDIGYSTGVRAWIGEPDPEGFFAGSGSSGPEPAERWQWQVTRIMRRPDGSEYETAPFTISEHIFFNVGWYDPDRTYFPGRVAAADSGFARPRYVMVEEDVDHVYLPLRLVRPTDTYERYPYNNPTVWSRYAWDNLPAGGEELFVVGDLPERISIHASHQIRVDWNVWAGDPDTIPSGSDRIVGSRVYRGRDGVFGLIGVQRDQGPVTGPSVSNDFVDEGNTPDWAVAPPEFENPFEIIDGDGTTLRFEQPLALSIYEGRRVFGGTDERPGDMWGSAVEQYENFDQKIVQRDDESYYLSLATNRYEKIKALVPRQGLIVLTDASEWIVGGSGSGELLTPNSIAARLVSQYGSGDLEPLTFGEFLWFLQRKGTVPRAWQVASDGGASVGKSVDVSSLSRHLFNGHTIVSWCYAEDPWSTIWAVRDDGVLLSCAFSPNQELVAWAKHEIADGLVEAVASLPEGTEDAVYLVVRRGDDAYLERLASRSLTDVVDGVFLDAATQFDGTNTAANNIITVQAGAAGDFVTITPDGGFDGGGAGLNNRTIILYPDGSDPVTFIINETTTEVSPGVFELQGQLLSALSTSFTGTTWAWCETEVEGLCPALFGSDVYAFVDGFVQGPLTVERRNPTNYAVTLTTPGVRGVVGLRYNCDFESLDMAPERGRTKIVRAVSIETNGARGGYVGPTLDSTDLREVVDRQVAHDYGEIPLLTEEIRTLVNSRWESNGRVAYRQVDPVPIEILGLTREVEFGEK